MTNKNEALERKIIALVAMDRIGIPIKSMAGKVDRQKPKLARDIDMPGRSYSGERVYARIKIDDTTQKARTMSEAVNEFAEKYSRHGKILKGLIEEKRQAKESNLYFGINAGCRLTANDYLSVMENLGFSGKYAENLYQDLMTVSRNLSKKREEERSILIG